MSQFLPFLKGYTDPEGYRWNSAAAKHINPEPGSQESIRTIQDFMHQCRRNHEFCNKVESHLCQIRRLPKRVVEVGPEDNTSIRVYEHDYDKQMIKKPYVALSHSWGRTKHTELNNDNHTERCKNIPYAELPILYKDAIDITRRFGIAYIWIDSLCIIQGDDADFFDQGAKMALIYEGAEFVLAAASSPNGDTTLCNTRIPLVTIHGQTGSGEGFTIFAREACSHSVLGDDNAYARASKNVKRCILNWDVDGTQDPGFHDAIFDNYPLHYRAWCLQERILGSKVLHFAKSELLFECLTSLACECGFFAEHQADPLLESRRAVKSGREEFGRAQLEEVPLVAEYERNQYHRKLQWAAPGPAISLQQQQSTRHREVWRDLVVQYSQKKLGGPEDGLAAIAGLAERWEDPQTTGRYLSGLWEKDLLIGLRWMPDTEEPESVLARKFDEQERKKGGKVDRYIAPSWSWASIQRGVAWRDDMALFHLDDYYVSIHLEPGQTNCESQDNDFKYGPVSNGYIFITGNIMKMDFVMLPVVFGGGAGGQDKSVILVKNGVTGAATAVDSLSRLADQPILKGRFLETGVPMQELWCLRFCSKPFPSFEGHGLGSEGALLLVEARRDIRERQPAKVQAHDWVFERVGFTYGYMTEAWDHEKDAKQVDMYLV